MAAIARIAGNTVRGGRDMSVKQKLLEAVGQIDIRDIGEEALIDILVNKIEALEKNIKELHSENGAEKQRLIDATERMHCEIKEMNSNPMYGASGRYYFLGRNKERICLYMLGGKIVEMFERYKKIDFCMQHITSKQWESLEEK
jgi:hypothetical protein